MKKSTEVLCLCEWGRNHFRIIVLVPWKEKLNFWGNDSIILQRKYLCFTFFKYQFKKKSVTNKYILFSVYYFQDLISNVSKKFLSRLYHLWKIFKNMSHKNWKWIDRAFKNLRCLNFMKHHKKNFKHVREENGGVRIIVRGGGWNNFPPKYTLKYFNIKLNLRLIVHIVTYDFS